ncbi:hypothetical protein JNUCC64_21495 [Streptomyces sp. JNUCC 64]
MSRGLTALALAWGVAVSATGCLSADGPDKPDPDALDEFLRAYVNELNTRDSDGLAELLGEPHGTTDARARLAEYGGQDWRVTWSHRSEFEGVYQVRIRGTADDGRKPVRVSEVLVWSDGHWSMTPLGGSSPSKP